MTAVDSHSERELDLFTIYEHPKDYPRGYIVRRWVARSTGFSEAREAWATETLEDARLIIPDGLFRMEREADDDPTIVETWL